MRVMPPFCLTPAHDRLLRGSAEMPVGLYQLHLATADQLGRLHYRPTSIHWVKAQLKLLTDHGYTQADAVPTKRGNGPYYYTLGVHGMRYLASIGLDVRSEWRATKEVGKHALFLNHALELNDVLISAQLLPTIAPIRLHRFEHERELKRRPIKVDGHTVIPDAFLEFRNQEGRRKPILLEHDRGTEGESHFKRKVRAYNALLTSGAYQELFGVKSVCVAVTTFMGEVRSLQLRQWTHAETDSNRFWFTSLTAPPAPSLWVEPRWRTPTSEYQPLLGG